jgi:hypothetical protein
VCSGPITDYKMDLKGAYTLLSFWLEDVGLFGMLLTGDIFYFIASLGGQGHLRRSRWCTGDILGVAACLEE